MQGGCGQRRQKMFKHFVLACLCVFILTGAVIAQQISMVADEFYNGLADVIEQNMNYPDACVTAVDNYFTANQDKVGLIRQETSKAMELIAPQIDKYMSMTQEEAAAMKKAQSAQANRPASQMSAAGKRYNDAFKAFMTQYPKQGMKIAGKTMQLVPGLSVGTAQRGRATDSP
jgi:hypothetical protein